MSRKRGRGLGSLLTSAVWTLLMIGIVLAALQLSGANSIEDTAKIVKDKASEYSECIPSGECGVLTLLDDVKSMFNKSSEGKGSSSNTNSNSDGEVDSGESDSSTNDNSNDKSTENDLNDNSDYLASQVSREEKGYRGPDKGEPYVNMSGLYDKQSSHEMLSKLEIVEDKIDNKKDVGYSRRDWKHWIGQEDRACWNTRSEILHRDAVKGSVKYVDKKKQATEAYEEACAIGIPVEDKKGQVKVETKKAGEWIDPYSGKRITDSRTIDIDHVIPLSNAARQGGQDWSAEKKQEFANDPDNLLATSAKENRSKGEKGPGKYMPPYKPYHCQYAKTYTSLSHKYNLTITQSDYEVLEKAIQACEH